MLTIDPFYKYLFENIVKEFVPIRIMMPQVKEENVYEPLETQIVPYEKSSQVCLTHCIDI